GCGGGGGPVNAINNSPSLQQNANFNIQSSAAGTVTGQIRAISGQTADLLQLQDSSGAVLAHFTVTGAIQLKDGLIAYVGTSKQIKLANTGQLQFGAAGDTNLYRSAAGVLVTDGQLQLQGATGTAGALNLVGGTTASNGIAFGTDTDLYRAAAGVLQTDGQLSVGKASTTTGQLNFYGSGSANSIALQGPAAPGSGLTLTLPNETGTLCSTGSVCTGYAPASPTGSYIQNGTSQQVGANFNIDGSGTIGTNLTVQGTISSPGSGTGSEHFGAGSSVGSQTYSLAVGNGATVSGTKSIAIGTNSSAAGGVAIGYGAVVTGGGSGLAVGNTASSAARGTALGNGTTASADGIAIGNGATAGSNRLVIGSSTASSYIQDAYIGNGVTAAAPQGFTLHATGGSGTDIAGAYLNIAAGQGTGAGAGGSINLQIAKPGTTGSSLNSLTTVFSLSGTNGSALFKNAADSTTAFQIQNAAGTSNLLVADTTNSVIGIGMTPVAGAGLIQLPNVTGTANGIALGNANLHLTGGGSTITLSGVAGFAVSNAGSYITANNNNAGFGAVGPSNQSGIKFGAGTYDTNLYRLSAGVLQTDGGLVVAGSSGLTLGTASSVTGATKFYNSGGSGSITLQGSNPGGTAYTLNLPAENGTLCSTGSVCTGYAPSTGSTGYIWNGTGLQSSANFNIDGTGTAGTLNGTTGINTGAGAGTQRIDASGNLTNIGSISASGNISTTGGTLAIGGTGNSYIMGALGLGTTTPQTGSALTIANGSWITGVTADGSSYVNMFRLNSNNTIDVGAALNVDGGIVLPTDAGQVTLVDLPTDTSATAGTPESYTFRVGSTNAMTVYGEADGAGGAQNLRVAIGSSITPQYTLDVGGDINTSTQYRIGGTVICTSSGCTPASGSGNYIQNQTASPQTAGFNINGTGTAATLNATTAIQLNGTSINTAGTLSNVAYLNAASQTFTGANTFSASGTALSVTNNATVGGTLTIGADATISRTGPNGIQISGTTSGAAALTIQA
ncbi:MAG TPA: hypothetical protein VHA37_09810, partial [Candidatus Saccharimonadales bacterium]|nr:hypothetical protein [Candidatus Saccharimonadales bacterium]